MCKIKVSVIIPVYNAGKYLEECLLSVINQTLEDIEIIIINDCSTDNSSSIIKEYSLADKRIHTYTLEINSGVSVARNTGIEQACGQYVIFIDADDYWPINTLLASLYDRAIRDQSDIVRFGMYRKDSIGRIIARKDETDMMIELTSDHQWNINYSIWSMLIARSVIEHRQLRFKSGLTMGEDALFCCELYCNAKILSTINLTGYCYRLNTASINNSDWDGIKLFDTVRWFRMAIDVIRSSPVYARHPELLQNIIIERLRMLTDRLASMAFSILREREMTDFIDAWAECFAFADHHYILTKLDAIDPTSRYRRVLEYILLRDTAGIKHIISQNQECLTDLSNSTKITLNKADARELGKHILKTKAAMIHFELGNGIIFNMSRSKALALAEKLILNTNAHFTLNIHE